MIATLSGILDEKFLEHVVLDVQGVGYGVYVTSEEHGRLETGKPAKLYIYEHIREVSHDLYGFSSLATTTATPPKK